MRDPILTDHGTKAFALPPSALVHAAANDLSLRDNRTRGGNAATRRYLFAWEHVRLATSPFDLIRRALNEPSEGAGSNDRNTRMIYRDPDLLRAALALGQGVKW